MAKVRLWRFYKWYRRLRRNPLTDEGYFNQGFPRRFALSVAWYWSSDYDAFVRASSGPEVESVP